MLTEKEKVLAIWFLGESRTSRALYDAGLDDLDVLIDPATVPVDSSDYVGHIPYFLPFSQILAKVVQVGEAIKENSAWDSGANFNVHIPLLDLENPIVAQSSLGGDLLTANVTMIRQDALDRLIADADLVNAYLVNAPSDAEQLEGYDKNFAYMHRLPIFKLALSETPIESEAIKFLRDLSLALFQYYVPSSVQSGVPSPLVYRPANPGMPIVHDFSRPQ